MKHTPGKASLECEDEDNSCDGRFGVVDTYTDGFCNQHSAHPERI